MPINEFFKGDITPDVSFRRLAEMSPAGITQVDKGGEIVYANRRAEKILGLEVDEITDRTYDDPTWKITGYDGSDYPKEKLPFEIVKRTGKPVENIKHAIEWPNGERKLLLINGSPIFDENGVFDGMVGTIQDVTEVIRMEQLEDHFTSVISSVRDVNQLLVKENDRDKLIEGICKILIDGRGYHNVWIALIDEENELIRTAESGLGEDFDPMIDRLKEGNLPETTKEALVQPGVVVTSNSNVACQDCPLSSNYKDRGALTARLTYQTKVYGIISASTPLEYVNDEQERELFQEVAGDIGFGLHDIELSKKRKQALQEITEQEKRLELALEGGKLGMWDWNIKTDHVEFNDRWAEMKGYDPDEIEPHYTSWAELVHPEDLPKAEEELHKHLQGKADYYEAELRMRDKSGEWIWIQDRGKVIEWDADGNPARACGTHLDITERKRAEQEVERQRDRARRYLDIAGSIIVLIDKDRKVQEINKRGCELLGYVKDEIIGRDMYEEFVPDRVKKKVIKETRIPLMEGETEKVNRYENPVVTKDGEERTIAWVNNVMREDGQIVGTLSSGIDITERVKAQKRLKESEKRYRALFENTGTAVCIIEEDTTLSFVNKQFEELSGYSSEEIEGEMSWTDFVTEEDLERMKRYHDNRRRNSGAPNQYEFTFVDRDGNHRDILLAIDVIEGTGKSVASLLDISRRKQAERKIRQNEKRFRSYVESSPFGIFIADEHGDYVDVNKAATKITGYQREELLNMNLLDLFGQNEKDKAKMSFDSLRQQEEASTEIPFIKKDGTKRYWRVTAVKISPDRYLGFVEDITERKNLEKQIKADRDRIRDSFIQLAETTSRVLGVRDPYTREHEQRVAQLAREVGRRMGLEEDRLLGLYLGGLLHDIGKIIVPETILTKPGELTDIEWQMIRSHPEVGYNKILKETNFPWPVAEMTLHHHERLDGSGYPDGLEGDELTTEVRILATVDVVEAMSTRRPYRAARSKERTLTVLKEGRGDKFDPEVVDILVDMIKEGGIEFGG